MPVLADALDIQEGRIITQDDKNGVIPHADVTGLTIDGRRPEEFVNVIGGQIRRRRPEETDWSVDKAMLYDNLITLKILEKNKFDIEVLMIDPLSDPAINPNSSGKRGQKLTVYGCRISDESINITDSSTQRISGRADRWDVVPIGSSQPPERLVT